MKIPVRPPHFIVLGAGGVLLDVSGGRYNAFFSILALLYIIRRDYDGYVHNLFLGDKSIDVLRILDASSVQL